MNHKRVQRIWQEKGLRVPQSSPKRRQLGDSTVPARRLQAERPNQVWALHFMSDSTAPGFIETRAVHPVSGIPSRGSVRRPPRPPAHGLLPGRQWSLRSQCLQPYPDQLQRCDEPPAHPNAGCALGSTMTGEVSRPRRILAVPYQWRRDDRPRHPGSRSLHIRPHDLALGGTLRKG